MVEDGVLVLGGVGLYLMGMATLTDNLKLLAHDRLRRLLGRSTRSPLSGAVTGAAATALVQSSSATTVAAVGFVGAGLMTFNESLGLVLGANLGATVTGWLIALLGFNLKLREVMLPLILVGALWHLFGKGRWAAVGLAVAGFGLIFVGIGTMQQGMEAVSHVVTPGSFPSATLLGRVWLALIGLALALVLQSSGAGVAMALTALYAGNLELEQAASMVIGMSIGTTGTAMLATIGGTVQARRTGLAHVVYNLFSGAGAFLLLTPYLTALEYFAPRFRASHPEIALVTFHSLYHVIGVSVTLLVIGRFASLLVWLVPERSRPLTWRLDPQLTKTPDLAVAAVQVTVCDLVSIVFHRLAAVLRDEPESEEVRVEEIREALTRTTRYLRFVLVDPEEQPLYSRHEASFHILDHLRRLVGRLSDTRRWEVVRESDELREYVERLASTADEVAARPRSIDGPTADRFHEEYRDLKSQEKPFRRANIAKAAQLGMDPEAVMARTEAVRGLRRTGYHVWRIVRHLHSAYLTEEGNGMRREEKQKQAGH